MFQDNTVAGEERETIFKGEAGGIHVYSDLVQLVVHTVLCYKTEHSGKPFSGP